MVVLITDGILDPFVSVMPRAGREQVAGASRISWRDGNKLRIHRVASYEYF